MPAGNDESQGHETEDGFLYVGGASDDGAPIPPEVTRRVRPGNGGNGHDNGNGNEAEDAQAELARLRAENARLRLGAPLEARREEVATVGDVLDALAAEREALRVEVLTHYEDACDDLAARVERRVLVGIEGEPEGEPIAEGKPGKDGKPPTPQDGKGKTRPGRKRDHLYRDGATGEVYIWRKADEPDAVPDDGEIVIPA